MHKLTKALSIAAAWPLLIALLLGAIIGVAFSPSVYLAQYEKLGQADVIGCSPTTLENITYHLIAYMAGGEGAPADLTIYALIDGERREVFSEKEKQHMADVKYLFDMARYVAVICVIATLLLFVCATLLAPAGRKARTISSGLLWGMGSFAVVAIAVGVYAALDFSRFWSTFHHLIFSNDLWLLDPTQDVLIQMMPQQFFINLITWIALFFGGAAGLIALVAGGVRLYCGRRDARAAEEEDEIALVSARVRPAPSDDSVTVIPAADGDRLMLPEDESGDRPDADQIFEEFGLSDADDQPLLPDEPATTRPMEQRSEPPVVPLTDQEPKTDIVLPVEAKEVATPPMAQEAIEPAPQPEGIPLPEEDIQDPSSTMQSAMEALKEEAALEQAQQPAAAVAEAGEGGALSVRVPVTIPASALDITRLSDGLKLELKLELYLRDDGTLGPALALGEAAGPAAGSAEAAPASTAATPAEAAPKAGEQGPSIEELLSQMDQIMQNFPSEEEKE